MKNIIIIGVLYLLFSLAKLSDCNNEAAQDIQAIKTLVTQIFQWYKNEMQTVR